MGWSSRGSSGTFARRSAAKHLAATAGGAVAGSLATACGTTRAPRPSGGASAELGPWQAPAAVGLMLPQSTLYPALGDSLLAGFRLGLEQPSDRSGAAGAGATRLVTEHTVPGPSSARRAAETLLERDGVHVVVGLLDGDAAADMRDLFDGKRRRLVALSLGENLPRVDAPASGIVPHSLVMWQSIWALGRWAAGAIGKSAAMLASFHDSGFDSFYAFQLGFESAGGRVTETRVTHLPAGTDDLTPALGRVVGQRPDLVFASYSAEQAAELVRAYARTTLYGRVPLLGPSFLVGETELAAAGDDAVGVITALPWGPSLDTPAHRAFRETYVEQSGREADAFALLGFDTGRRIAKRDWAIRGRTGEGPDDNVPPSVYVREVRRAGRVVRNEIVATISGVAETERPLRQLRSSLRTGWLNAYLYA